MQSPSYHEEEVNEYNDEVYGVTYATVANPKISLGKLPSNDDNVREDQVIILKIMTMIKRQYNIGEITNTSDIYNLWPNGSQSLAVIYFAKKTCFFTQLEVVQR